MHEKDKFQIWHNLFSRLESLSKKKNCSLKRVTFHPCIRKDKIGEVSFTTGWMVYPNGKIQLTTPYADN